MGKRKKVIPKAEQILSLEEANIAFAEIAGKSRELKVIEATMNAEIDLAKAEAEAASRALKARISELELGLAAFATANRDALFEKKKTISLSYGSFGFRKSTVLKTKPKHTWEMVLGRLKELGEKTGIRTKEDVDKEVLRTWSDEKLDTVHVRRLEKDLFWLEIVVEELSETEA